ncbi:hypothetical protein MJO29_016675 [Puccinia striiformis f. sp. tritici]|nr:hypothetical protein MJO29_016675 [Puccinia striiformis f. sp. tritici]
MFRIAGRLLRQRPPTKHYSTKPAVDIINELENRGLVAQLTSRAIRQHLIDKKRTVYLGIDPTAKSLHLGNLLVLIALLHFNLNGHRTIVLLGGATGSVGDPSGRDSERVAISSNLLNVNLQSIHNQLTKLIENSFIHLSSQNIQSSQQDATLPIIKNNLEWTKDLKLLDFLNSVGKVSRVSSMLARDSVKQRIESGTGISFTEFTYQLLQAQDFVELRSRYECTIQLGGSDQYGNIMSGIELMSKLHHHQQSPSSSGEEAHVAYGLTIPLLTTKNGQKFGKSAGNAVWLDPTLTSPVEFYQTFLNIPDSDVIKYLKMLTFIPLDKLHIYIDNQANTSRSLQKLLAKEVTLLVHGESGLNQALQGTRFLFPDESCSPPTSNSDHHHEEWSKEVLDHTFQDTSNWIQLKPDQVVGKSIGELLVISSLCPSKSEAKRTIKSGGIRLNHAQITDFDRLITTTDLIDSTYLLVMRGKSTNYRIIKLT